MIIIKPRITELLRDLNNAKEVKKFEDVLNLNSSWNRQLSLGEIDLDVGDAIEEVIRFFNQLDDEQRLPIKERDPIKILINSTGGDLNATFTIIDSINMSKTPVYTIATGCTYSGGFFTFISGHKRLAYPHATFMFHEGSVSNNGDAGKFRNFASFYEKQLEAIKALVLDKTSIDEKFYEKIRRDDYWINAKEAIEKGVADEILTSFVY